MTDTQAVHGGMGTALGETDKPLPSGSTMAAVALFLGTFVVSGGMYLLESILPFSGVASELFFLLYFFSAVFWVFMLLPFWLIMLAVYLWRWRWRSLLLIAVAPFLGLAPVALALKAGITPAVINSQFASLGYMQTAKATPTGAEGRKLLAFYRGLTGASALGPGVIHYIVYDDTGEIALPREQRSSAWLARAAQTKDVRLLAQEDWLAVTHLHGHFYHVQWSECPACR